MKNSHKTSIAGIAVLLAATTQIHAQSTNKWYVGADAGVALTQNLGITQSPFGYDGDVKFDTGVRGGLTLGYEIKPCLSVELQAGLVENDVSAIHGNNLSAGANASLYQIPVLVNAIYKPLHGAFQPYLGVGAGFEAGIFDISGITPASNVSLFAPSFNDSDLTFAYQAQAGFTYSLCSHCAVGVAYKFLGTTEHNWSSNGNQLKTDGILTHAIVASLTWKF